MNLSPSTTPDVAHRPAAWAAPGGRRETQSHNTHLTQQDPGDLQAGGTTLLEQSFQISLCITVPQRRGPGPSPGPSRPEPREGLGFCIFAKFPCGAEVLGLDTFEKLCSAGAQPCQEALEGPLLAGSLEGEPENLASKASSDLAVGLVTL